MKKSFLHAALLGASLLSPVAMAGDLERTFNYAEFTFFEPDDEILFDNIYEFEGKATVFNNIYVRAQAMHYSDALGGFDLNEYLLGGGIAHKLNSDLTGFVDLNVIRADIAGGNSDNFWLARVGGVYHVNRHLELSGSLRHVDSDDSDNEQQYEITVRYYAFDNISLSVGYLDGIGSDSFKGAVTGSIAYHF